jgi:hypothetical protein
MGRKGRNRQRDEPPQPARKRFTRFVLPAFCIVAGGTLVAIAINNQKDAQTCQPLLQRYTQKAKSLDELLKMSPEQLAAIDIAEMNLLCATGLPGAEKLDIAKCLARLDEWAERVREVTGRHLYRAHDPRWAEHYKHSENWLRVEFLAQVLQEDCGVHYNMQRIRDIDFGNSKDLLIHGMIDDPNGGTCASMPVLHVAVGRRLVYPLRLVLTKGHVFCRWDDGKERFNIESTGEGGTDSYPDEHYKTWPMKWTEAEKKADCYLISLTPAEELACFLGSRGHCLLENGRITQARYTYAIARRLAPMDPAYPSWIRMAEDRLFGPTFSRIDDDDAFNPRATYRVDRHEAERRRLEAINAYNRRLREEQMRSPVAPSPYPPRPRTPYGPEPASPSGLRPAGTYGLTPREYP